MKKSMLVKSAKAVIESMSNPSSGIWCFWIKNDGTLHYEFQCGSGYDFALKVQNNKITLVK